MFKRTRPPSYLPAKETIREVRERDPSLYRELELRKPPLQSYPNNDGILMLRTEDIELSPNHRAAAAESAALQIPHTNWRASIRNSWPPLKSG
jgi:hypothetical protein